MSLSATSATSTGAASIPTCNKCSTANQTLSNNGVRRKPYAAVWGYVQTETDGTETAWCANHNPRIQELLSIGHATGFDGVDPELSQYGDFLEVASQLEKVRAEIESEIETAGGFETLVEDERIALRSRKRGFGYHSPTLKTAESIEGALADALDVKWTSSRNLASGMTGFLNAHQITNARGMSFAKGGSTLTDAEKEKRSHHTQLLKALQPLARSWRDAANRLPPAGASAAWQSDLSVQRVLGLEEFNEGLPW